MIFDNIKAIKIKNNFFIILGKKLSIQTNY